jgi:uncharacterized protein (DUF2147 family)
MVNRKLTKALTLALMLASGGAFAQATPAGLWKVIDDETKQPLSYVRIRDAGGVLSGSMEKLLDSSRQDAKCDKCTDARKNQPMLGMTIMRNVNAAADGIWEGGEILDPNNGKTYRVRLKPLDGGKVLEVRGYIGPFFRNQRWLRVE